MSGPLHEGDVSFYDLATPLLRRWRLVVLLPLALGVGAAALSLVVPPSFTAVTTFTPEAGGSVGLPSGLAGLAGLAGQLGITTGSGGNVTPEFFASVLKSRELLEAALISEFPSSRDSTARHTLLDLMHVRGRSPEERTNVGIRRLQRLTATTVDPRTGIVTLRVEQADPELAAAVANRLTELLNRFNLERRQSQSREQKRFAAQRLEEAEGELRAAEQQLLRFLQANRQYRGAPLLEYEINRLQRDIQLKQELFVTLSKAFEDARIAEVRDTPVLTIIDRAVPPFQRTSPRRALYVLVTVVFGALLSTSLALLIELQTIAQRADRPDYRSFSEAWTNARRQIGGLLRRPHNR